MTYSLNYSLTDNLKSRDARASKNPLEINNNPHLIVNHFFIGSSAGSPVISGGESGGSERDGDQT